VDFERLPSFLISLCLHLGVAALIIWWPASPPVPAPPTGTLVDIYFTLGAPGRSVPEPRQAIPEPASSRERPQQVSRPQQEEQPRTVAQVERHTQVQPPPEVRQIERPQEPVREPEPELPAEAIPIPLEPEKPIEPEPEIPKEPEPEPEPEQPKEPEPPRAPEPERPRTPAQERPRTPERPAVDRALIDRELADLARALSAESDRGTGPGGSGGDGIGTPGDYLQVIHSRVKANWSFPAQADRRQYSTLVNIRIAPDGTITQIRRLRSSGNAFYDSSVESALVRTARFEPPPRPDLMNIDIEFAF